MDIDTDKGWIMGYDETFSVIVGHATVRKGSLRDAAALIGSSGLVLRANLSKMFTSSVVRNVVYYLKLVDAIYVDDRFIISAPWLLALSKLHGKEWVEEVKKLAKVLDPNGLSPESVAKLEEYVRHVENTPWKYVVYDVVLGANILDIIGRVIHELSKPTTASLEECNLRLTEMLSYIGWILTIITSLMAVTQIDDKEATEEWLRMLEKQMCVEQMYKLILGEESKYCKTARALVSIYRNLKNHYRYVHGKLLGAIYDYYKERLGNLKSQGQYNARSVLTSFVRGLFSSLLTYVITHQ